MSLYLAIKYIHMLTALLSISGFILRGIWMLQSSPMLQRPLVRRLPHVNDTLLLLSALLMVFISGQYPFVHCQGGGPAGVHFTGHGGVQMGA